MPLAITGLSDGEYETLQQWIREGAVIAETRLYFDLIRSGGENNFLHFMPPEVCTAMRNAWYQGSAAQLKITDTYEIVNEDIPVQIAYRTSDPKTEFVSLVTARLKSAAGPADALNRCTQPPCYRSDASTAERQAEASLQTLGSKPASLDAMHFVDFMPDEEKRREPDEDTLTVYQGLLGSYPNFMFNVPLDRVEAFAAASHAVRSREQFMAVASRYGLPRTHPEIWSNFHWFVDYMHRISPVEAGIYDLNRYKKMADLMADETG